MSKTQDGFLEKVAKAIKRDVYTDEPDAVAGLPVIERLRSLAGTKSPGVSNIIAERSQDISNAADGQEQPVVALGASPPVDNDCGALELDADTKSLLEQQEDAFIADESLLAEDPIKPSAPMATIMVVEDEIVTQRLMKLILEERGYEVVVAGDGVDALMALGKINVDLILCDINMPNLDGFKLVEVLNQKNIFIPVIFVTVREDVEDEIRGLTLGAKDYIRKPINRDLLLLRIRKALDR